MITEESFVFKRTNLFAHCQILTMNGSELLLNILFSSIGAGYMIYGKKRNRLFFLVDGLVLTIYPYFIKSPLTTSIVGLILTILPFLARRIWGNI